MTWKGLLFTSMVLISIFGSAIAYAQDQGGPPEYYDKIKENQLKFTFLIIGLAISGGATTGFLFFRNRKKQTAVK
jgi:hypothetical protein